MPRERPVSHSGDDHEDVVAVLVGHEEGEAPCARPVAGSVLGRLVVAGAVGLSRVIACQLLRPRVVRSPAPEPAALPRRPSEVGEIATGFPVRS